MSERVTIDIADSIAEVRLDRPDKLNALDVAMFEALVAAGERLCGASALRAVIVSGNGRAFCAGIDLAAFGTLSQSGPLARRSHGNANLFQRAAMVWQDVPVPVIVAIHGVCFGGGLQLAAGGDIRVTTPDARLSIMETKWGLVPDMGGHALWRGNVRDDVRRELTYTAREFSGDEAVAMGFATFADPEPLSRALSLAVQIAEKSPAAIRQAKQLAKVALSADPTALLLAESRAADMLLHQPQQREALAAGQAGRPARF